MPHCTRKEETEPRRAAKASGSTCVWGIAGVIFAAITLVGAYKVTVSTSLDKPDEVAPTEGESH